MRCQCAIIYWLAGTNSGFCIRRLERWLKPLCVPAAVEHCRNAVTETECIDREFNKLRSAGVRQKKT